MRCDSRSGRSLTPISSHSRFLIVSCSTALAGRSECAAATMASTTGNKLLKRLMRGETSSDSRSSVRLFDKRIHLLEATGLVLTKYRRFVFAAARSQVTAAAADGGGLRALGESSAADQWR